MRFVCYALAVLCLVLAPARAVAADAHTKDAADVRLAVTRFLTAFENLEWETFRSSFDDNVTVFFPTPEPPLRFDGRAAVEAHFQEVFKAIRASTPGGPPYQQLRPKDLRIEMIPPGKQLDVMLAEGEIPAMLSPELPPLFLKGDKRIVRLFPNYKDVELAYFRRTGIFPIMHVTTIRQEIVDKYPWVPTNLVKAFEAAKNLAYRRIANPRMVPIAWVRTALEEQEEVLGPDPWAYGLTPANRKNLETVLRYTHQQGMISRTLPLDALFADTDLGDAGGPDGI
jgi:hypothetical protein